MRESVLLLFTAGCGFLHTVPAEPPPPVSVPDRFVGSGGTESLGRWWESFGDRELDGLVESAFGGNLDLRAAYARLAAADAAVRVGYAAYIPSVSAGADVNTSRSVFNFGGGQGPVPGGGAFGVELSQFNLQAALSYEVDLWGRFYGQAMAGVAEMAASEGDLATMHVTVSATVVDTWLQLIEQNATLALIEEQRKVNATYLELVELRFRQGQASALDVFQQRQRVAALDAQVPPLKAQLDVLGYQLAVLLGRPPGAVSVSTGRLPELPPVPEVGIPAVLLAQRPDVRAAQARVVAADHRVGSAIGARFPRLSLSASGGFRGFDVVNGLFDNWLYNLVAGLTAPLTDQVRLEAEERQARARLEEQVANYGQAVLGALREVEEALTREVRQDALLEELDKQLEVAEATLAEARRRYFNGLSDYLPVLTALETQQTTEQRALAARRQRLSIRVQLCRALGGAWLDDVGKKKRREGEMMPQTDPEEPES